MRGGGRDGVVSRGLRDAQREPVTKEEGADRFGLDLEFREQVAPVFCTHLV